MMHFSLPINIAIPLHQVFETAGILIGVQFYRYLRKRNQLVNIFTGAQFALVIGCLIGAGIGNKTVFWIEHPHLWHLLAEAPSNFMQGQSMVGGLIGGWLGVETAKYFSLTKQSTGDLFVGPILLGLAIGRLGCFAAGLQDETFGIATQLPWAIDFGDGVARHPTQIYEIIFALSLWWLLERLRSSIANQPGLLFKIMFSSYLLWRLLIDGIKPVAYEFAGGLSGIQWVCLITLLIYAPLSLHSFLQWKLKLNGIELRK